MAKGRVYVIKGKSKSPVEVKDRFYFVGYCTDKEWPVSKCYHEKRAEGIDGGIINSFMKCLNTAVNYGALGNTSLVLNKKMEDEPLSSTLEKILELTQKAFNSDSSWPSEEEILKAFGKSGKKISARVMTSRLHGKYPLERVKKVMEEMTSKCLYKIGNGNNFFYSLNRRNHILAKR